MGYKLRREIRDLLPAGLLTPSERLLVLEIADSCGDETRTGWPGVEWLVAKCDVPSAKRVGEHFASIARKWFEIRVELGKDRHGKPFYAIPGKRMTYRMPTRPELVAQHGEEKVPKNQGLDACKDPENQGAKVPEIQGANPPKTRDPSSQFEPLKENTSSLSPREDEQPPAATVPTPRTEREIVEASPEPKNDKPTGTTGILLGAGLTPDEAGSFVGWADQLGGGPKGPGWYVTLHRNQTLQERIEEWRASGHVVTSCPECDDSGTTGDWMNPRPCNCIWWKDPDEARRRFRAAAAELGDCDHGVPGGDQTAPNGWRVCALCRGRDWVEIDLQPRTEERSPPLRRSTSALRAENALRVADELDRENGHGKYAPNARFPIKHQTFRNPPISAYEGEL